MAWLIRSLTMTMMRSRPQEKRNGFVFYQQDQYALETALNRALDLYYGSPELFQQLACQGMAYDYSWNSSAQRISSTL